MDEKKCITIVDLKNLSLTQKEEPCLDALAAVGSELVKAFKDIGFVYMTGHGVPEDVIDSVHKCSGLFFQENSTAKEKHRRGAYEIQGFTETDREKLSAGGDWYELKESFDVNNLEGEFPDDLVPAFRPAVRALVEDLTTLTYRILRALEQGLGVPKESLVKFHSEMFSGNGLNATCLRMLNYPPVPLDAPLGTVRCGAHTDYGTITFLMQDTMGGLEVRDISGKWVPATPIPGALLVNVGDLLQIWTNNSCKSTEHRVLVPEAELKQRLPRRSMAFFVHPDNQVKIQPLDGSPGTCVTALDHLNKRFAETYKN